MKILVIIRDFFPYDNASSNIIYTLSDEISKFTRGIDILTVKNNYFDSKFENYEKFNIFRVNDASMYSFTKYIKYIKNHPITGVLDLLKKVLIHKILKRIKIVKLNKLLENSFVRGLKMLKANNYDIIISVSAQIETSTAVLKYIRKKGKNFKYVLYQVDPLSTASNRSRSCRLLYYKYEVELYKFADKIITTQLIKGEKSYPDFDLEKIYGLEFPVMKDIQLSINNHIEKIVLKSENTINILFLGHLYPIIRNPYYALELFKQLNMTNIRLYFIGHGSENTLLEYKKKGLDIILCGRKSQQVCEEAMIDSDFLLNIGNTTKNNLPSKILSYIGSGKPIINVYKHLDCPTLEYTSKYPLSLNIYENSIDIEINKHRLKHFLNHKGKRLDYSIICDIYSESTIAYISKKFMDVINN